MKNLLKFLKGYEKQCVLGPLFKLLEASFELLIPLVVARIVDVAIAQGRGGHAAAMCGVMIALGVIGLLCSVTAQYFAARAAIGLSAMRTSIRARPSPRRSRPFRAASGR